MIKDPARGLYMGNRGGRLHDPETRELSCRRWSSKRWIACALRFRERRRTVWGEGYSELFFLDEATALAAGHRPCFECRRDDAVRFAAAFARGRRLEGPLRADAMDAILHADRLDGRVKRTFAARCADLPDGVMVAIGERAFRLDRNKIRPWTPSGYDATGTPPTGAVPVLTPRCVVDALACGYGIDPPAGA